MALVEQFSTTTFVIKNTIPLVLVVLFLFSAWFYWFYAATKVPRHYV